jgi:WD40 repeat protein
MSGCAARVVPAGLLLLAALAGCGGRPPLLLEARVPGASEAAWLLGDSLLAVALHGRGVTLLEAATGADLGSRMLPDVPGEAAFGLAASATGETLAVAMSDSVRVFLTRGLVRLTATPGRALSLALSGDGAVLRWSDGATGRSIAVPSGEVRLQAAMFAKRNSLRWVPFLGGFAWPEDRLVRFERDDTVAAMSLGPFMDGRPGQFSLSTPGATVAVAESTDHVSFWDARTEKMRWRLRLQGAASFDEMALSGDTWYLATARGGRARLLWAYTGRAVAAWQPHGGADVLALSFARDGRRLATVGADGRVRVWAVPEPRKERP